MYPFIETICIEGGQIHNLFYHNLRMNTTRREVLGCSDVVDLADFIQPIPYQERTKCRIEYRAEVEKVEYMPYTLRPVRSLKLITCDTFAYHYKSTDRSRLNLLLGQKGNSDDILIVRNGLLTDTSICNVALWNGSRWTTPATPLLEGTMRSSLIAQGEIYPADIYQKDLPDYSSIRLFNALISFGEIELPIERAGS